MRSLADSIVSAAGANGAYPIELVELIVDAGDADRTLRLSTGFKPITFDSKTFTPAGELLSIAQVTQTQDVQTTPITISLSGIPDEVVTALNTEPVIGSSVTIYRGYWSDTTNALVADPYERWSGIITSHAAKIDSDKEGTTVITVTCKSLIDALLSNKAGRFTSLPSFQAHNSTDLSMEYVVATADFNPRFGQD